MIDECFGRGVITLYRYYVITTYLRPFLPSPFLPSPFLPSPFLPSPFLPSLGEGSGVGLGVGGGPWGRGWAVGWGGGGGGGGGGGVGWGGGGGGGGGGGVGLGVGSGPRLIVFLNSRSLRGGGRSSHQARHRRRGCAWGCPYSARHPGTGSHG